MTRCTYSDPGPIADLCTRRQRISDGLALSIGPGNHAEERIYGTSEVARRGRVVEIVIEWEDENNKHKMKCNNCGGDMMRSLTCYNITTCRACGMTHDWSGVK